MSVRLYVGNLPKEVERQELQDVFSEAGDTLSAKVITDRKTGKCRGFGFITVKNDEQADRIIEQYNGHVFKENPLKIEKALPRSKSKKGEDEGSSAPAPSSNKSNRRGGGNGKSRRPSSSSSSDSGSNQPDPRWADELEKLKQMLATQTSNS